MNSSALARAGHRPAKDNLRRLVCVRGSEGVKILQGRTSVCAKRNSFSTVTEQAVGTLDDELKAEPERIRALYNVCAQRIEPVASPTYAFIKVANGEKS